MRRSLVPALILLSLAGLARAQDADPVAEMMRKDAEIKARQAASMAHAKDLTQKPLMIYSVDSPLPNPGPKAAATADPARPKEAGEGSAPWLLIVLGAVVVGVIVLMRRARDPKPPTTHGRQGLANRSHS